MVGNVLLFGLKLWAGIVSASAALIADAWHTLSDSLSSLIIIVSTWFSGKKADKEHPFGHGRTELIAALIVGMLLVFIAFEFFVEGVQRLTHHVEADYGPIALIVTVFSLISKELLAQYAFYAHRKSDFLSLKADAWHHRSDALSLLLILIGILAGRSIWWVDGVLTLIVSLMIAFTAFTIMKNGIKPLLGESPDKELLDYLSATCNTVTEIETNVHHVHLHRYGRHVELTFHLKLPPGFSLKHAHELVSRIEKTIRDEKDIDATIHMEPSE
ncbi:MAG: cation diffusion facilitator family transporter [Candidatus Marinimicrobia bacterium]|nr:cation diffusion facilitator family transporter [Candidatus Neomarinimicrobiota bacterium]